MTIFVTVVHVLLAVFMIFVILLQPGKDAGMGAAFGGGAATSAFGGRGAVTFLSKLTAACATLFFITSLGLSFVGLNTSVASKIVEKAATAPAPEAPKSVEQPKSDNAAAPSAPATPAPAPSAPATGQAPAGTSGQPAATGSSEAK
ncbi:MAG: preprotein translocase subunit SecG [Myxococcaceae bacterium]|nr:preprotein translocase subunit SecG [Myxococcaceae bacterium]